MISVQRLSTTLVAGLMVLAGFVTSACGQNLLKNPSFEQRDGESPTPIDWAEAISGAQPLAFGAEHHEGARSAAIVGDGQLHAWRQVVADPTPRAYTLTAMIKGQGIDLSGHDDHAMVYGHILYKGLAYSNATHFFIKIPPGTYDWTRFTVATQTSANAPIEKVLITVTGRMSAGHAYVDQVELLPNADLSPEARLKGKVDDLKSNLRRVGDIDPSVAQANQELDAALAALAQSPVDLKTADTHWVAAARALSHSVWAAMFPDAMSARPTEARMLYHGLARTQADCDHYIDVLTQANCNGVYYSLGAWQGVLHRSELVPVEPEWKDFDALKYSIDKVHARGIKAFAYIAAFYGTNESIADNPLYLAHPDWFAKGPDANMPTFPDPANPAVVDFVVKMYAELAKNYDLDGIGLDYIRYPTPDSLNYDARNRDAILARYGIDILKEDFWADPVKAKKVREYRAEQIGGVVKRVRDAVRAVKPNMKLIACLSSDPNESLEYGNNWSVSSVNLDYGSPMNYDDRSLDRELLARQKAVGQKNKMVWIPAIGGMPDVHQSWTLSTWAERVAIQRQAGADGIIIYRIGDLDPAVAAFFGQGPFYGKAAFPESRK